MKTFLPHNELQVRYGNRPVGALRLKDGQIGFQYAKSWLADGFSISPLSLPLSDDLFIAPNQDFGGLFGVFAASLPGGWGTMLRERYLSNHYENAARLTPLDYLSLVDEEGLGALSYLPNEAIAMDNETEKDLTLIKESIDATLKGLAPKQIALLYHLGGSSGGARPKITQKIDGEDWIIKFPGRYDPVTISVMEEDYNDCAASLGIHVAPHRLFPCGEGKVYGCQRFDRHLGKRYHMLSLSQLLETSIERPLLDYGHLFNVVLSLGGSVQEMEQVFSILCFNVYAHNYDDHGNNFSFLYDEEQKRYVLAPFYDLTGPEAKKEHEMMVHGSGNPKDEDILALARRFGFNEKKCQRRMAEIQKAVNKKLGQYLLY
jgi:serine/threonine-protein kinase HipA